MPHDSVSLNLDPDEALVLFELLSRWSEDEKPLEPLDASEVYALDRVQGKLQGILVEPLQADYPAKVEKARLQLRLRSGAA